MQAVRVQDDKTAGLKVEMVPIPELGPEDVLIKVYAAGMTPGVAKLIKMGRGRVPSTVGHEAAGTLVAIGKSVPNLAIGARVRLHPVVTCRKCISCTTGEDNQCQYMSIMGFVKFARGPFDLFDNYYDGGMAEYVRAHYLQVDPLPQNVSFEVAVKVHDMGTAIHVLKVANLQQDSVIVLTAPTGSMGTLTLRLAKCFPIKKIILVGRSRERLKSIQHLTSTPTEIVTTEGIEPQAIVSQLKSLAPEGIDTIIDYIPAGPLVSQIMLAMKVGGTLVHVGGNSSPLNIPLGVIMANCWSVVGNRGHRRQDVAIALKWLAEGKLRVDDLITHRFDLANIDRALEILEARSEPVWLSVFNIAT